ncbi:glycosyltransferase family 4 protein [Fulvivirgaceae bacterium BMA12]|uniref:Glycosyltransferase family 4 protein n=1 Tax=Agaribacillus aureus TaxID=3051825 RepID=A0ABT8LEK8_9BACT|nr:glycosyltransferase family 4 protein [Fulvivirgaceae bacterium BMA12]
MKVAIVINTSWNIYNFRLGLVKALIDSGHEVVAIAPEDDYSRLLVENGCKFVAVSMDTQGVNPIKDLKLVYNLWKTYRKIAPDVILQYTIKPNIYGSLAARLLKIPVINNVSGLGTVFLKKNLLSGISKLLYRIAFLSPKRVFFQNEDDRKLFLDRKLVKPEKTALLPGSGINLQRFSQLPMPDSGGFSFLLISRIIQDKGIREFIEAIRLLRSENVNARFQVLGAKDPKHKRGIPLAEIDQWVTGGLIEYLGTTDDVQSFISSAHCVLLPSYREGTPRTLLEAAATGRPLIASDVPGCREVVKHGYNGLLCEVKSAEDLAGKMKDMMNFEDEMLTEMGNNSRKLVENNFDEQIVINKYCQTIRSLDKKS